MAIVTQTDKRSGITYAYETTYYWDKEKQQSRSKRVCVGKVDPVSGEIVPTRGRAKSGGTSLTPKDLFSMSDEEFEKLSIKDLV